MNHMSLPIKMTIFVLAALLFLLRITPGQAAEGVQKLRVAYAAITAAFSIAAVARSEASQSEIVVQTFQLLASAHESYGSEPSAD